MICSDKAQIRTFPGWLCSHELTIHVDIYTPALRVQSWHSLALSTECWFVLPFSLKMTETESLGS